MSTKSTLKKAMALVLAFTMVFGAAPAAGVSWLSDIFDGFGISAQAASVSDLTFELINGGTEYEVSGCKSAATGALAIPETYDGKPVTSIGGYSFSYCTELSSVTIPDSVTSIGWWAFDNCTGLSSVTIPDSVTSIGDGAFYNTAWYNNQPDGLVYIGKVAYKYKGTMPNGTAIVIRDGTKGIADSAFLGCDGLSSVTIPDSVTSIGDETFSGCEGLGSVTIPDSVTSIGDYAFYYCTGLIDITVSSDNVKYSSQDGVLFNNDKTCLIQYPAGNTRTSYSIPNSVKSIGNRVFSDCRSLSSVTIGNSVTSIGDYAFLGCTGLSSIIIPNSVTSIGNSAFSCCTGLSSVTIGNSVTSIGDHAFYECTELSSVIIGNSVTSIGFCAFFGCTGLSTVAIPESVTSIGFDAFSGCTGLSSITIPDSVTNIGDGAFSGCTGLSSVTIPDSVTSISDSAFYECINLSDVYYGGDESDRAEMAIGSGNDNLINTTWHYNSNVQEVTSVSVSPTSKTLAIGAMQQLTATVAPADAANKNVTWTSSDTAIATVNANGLVTAVAVGEATITVETADGNETATCAIKVVYPTVSIKNLNNSSSIKYGETLRLTAEITDMPEGAKVKWSVQGLGVSLKVSEDGTTCDVKSAASGTVTVTAKIVDADDEPITDTDGNEISASQKVKSKAGFFQKLAAFFKRLFGLTKIIVQSIDQ